MFKGVQDWARGVNDQFDDKYGEKLGYKKNQDGVELREVDPDHEEMTQEERELMRKMDQDIAKVQKKMKGGVGPKAGAGGTVVRKRGGPNTRMPVKLTQVFNQRQSWKYRKTDDISSPIIGSGQPKERVAQCGSRQLGETPPYSFVPLCSSGIYSFLYIWTHCCM